MAEVSEVGSAKLTLFFEQAYSPDELKSLLLRLPEGSRVVNELPAGASFNAMAAEASQVLRRRGVLSDPVFFQMLKDDRPRRADEIAQLAEANSVRQPPVDVDPDPYPAMLLSRGVVYPRKQGDQELLAILDQTFENLSAANATTPTDVYLVGAWGVGKTTLAAEYVQRRSNRYQRVVWTTVSPPDSELSTGVGSRSLEAARERVSTALRHSAVRCGVAVDSPDLRPEKARNDLYRLLRSIGREALIVFDGVDDVGAVRDLLPREGGVHILVTCSQTDASRTRVVRVGDMEGEKTSAREILLRGAFEWEDLHELEQQAVDGICALVGHRPLGLFLAGGLLAHGPTTLPSKLFERMKGMPRARWLSQPEPMLRALYQATFDALLDDDGDKDAVGATAQALLRALIWLAPGQPIDEAVLFQLGRAIDPQGPTGDEALPAKGLRRLWQRGLAENKGTHSHVHILVRECARDWLEHGRRAQLEADARTVADALLALWTKETQGQTSRGTEAPSLDTLAPHVAGLALHLHRLGEGWGRAELQTICSAILRLRLLSQLVSASATCEALISFTGARPDLKLVHGAALVELGHILHRAHEAAQVEEAARQHTAALELARRHGGEGQYALELELGALQGLAMARLDMKRDEGMSRRVAEALKNLDEAEAVLHRLSGNRPLDEARLLASRGQALRLLGRPKDAVKALENALKKFEESSTRTWYGEGWALYLMGTCWLDLSGPPGDSGAAAQAVECLEASIQRMERVLEPAHPEIVSARITLAQALRRTGALAGADQVLREVIGQLERAGDLARRGQIASSAQTLGRVLWDRARSATPLEQKQALVAEAKASFEYAAAVYRQLSKTSSEAVASFDAQAVLSTLRALDKNELASLKALHARMVGLERQARERGVFLKEQRKRTKEDSR